MNASYRLSQIAILVLLLRATSVVAQEGVEPARVTMKAGVGWPIVYGLLAEVPVFEPISVEGGVGVSFSDLAVLGGIRLRPDFLYWPAGKAAFSLGPGAEINYFSKDNEVLFGGTVEAQFAYQLQPKWGLLAHLRLGGGYRSETENDDDFDDEHWDIDLSLEEGGVLILFFGIGVPIW